MKQWELLSFLGVDVEAPESDAEVLSALHIPMLLRLLDSTLGKGVSWPRNLTRRWYEIPTECIVFDLV